MERLQDWTKQHFLKQLNDSRAKLDKDTAVKNACDKALKVIDQLDRQDPEQ